MTRKVARTALAALAVALLAVTSLHPQLTRRARELIEGPSRSVVVLARDLALGAPISRAALDFRELPERYLEERHIEAHDLERVLGARAATTVPTGSALLWSDLDQAPEARTLAGLVRSGKRAFTLPGTDVGFSGLLRPGDRVDVLFTRAEGGSLTLLQNVLVLTVGSDQGAAASARVQPSERVTLSVDLEQAQLLAASEGRGVLRLALRNPLDLALVDTPPVRVSPGGSVAELGLHGGAP
ncbi:MAG: hypothetical protein RLZZ450_3790 [Pseudomonadota bacterium]|jgi:pilus assembly protein CpaB